MTKRWMIGAVLAVGCQASAEPGVMPAAQEAGLEVVVANQQSASASILSDDGTTMKHVAVGNGPHEAAVSPDGRVGVVTIYGVGGQPGNQLAVIDLVQDIVVRTIDLGEYTRPHGVVFLGNSSSRVAVSSEATRNVVLVDLSTGAIEAIGTNARASHMVAVNAAGTRAWTANIADNNVSEIDLVAKRFLRTIAVPAQPEGIAVTPNGAEVWVGSNATGAVTVIATNTGEVVQTLGGMTFPYRLTVTPDGRRMGIVDAQGGQLVIANVDTHEIAGRVNLAEPRGVQFSPDSRTAFVTLAGGSLAVIDMATMAVTRTLAVQASPDGVGVGVRR